MGKHCKNKLIIKGDETQLNIFLGNILNEKNEIKMDGIYPLPPNINEDDMIEMKRVYFGTSDIIDVHISRISNTEVKLKFLSNYHPPKKWVLIAAKQYGKLDFNLKYENNDQFIGSIFINHNIEKKYEKSLVQRDKDAYTFFKQKTK